METIDIMPYVREVFMADVPNADLPKFKDKLQLFYMKTVDFLEQNKASFTKENIVKYADKIKRWEIKDINTSESSAEVESATKNDISFVEVDLCSIQAEISQLKKYGIVITLILVLVIIFKS